MPLVSVHGMSMALFFASLPCQEGYLWPAKSSEPQWLHGKSALGLGRLHGAPGRAAAKPLTGAGKAKNTTGVKRKEPQTTPA